MGRFFGTLTYPPTGGSGGSTALGTRLAFASPAGAGVAANPAGFSSAVGRLLVTLSADTTWISLPAGTDGQLLDIKIVAGNFVLTLPSANFPAISDQFLGLGNHMLLYYDAIDLAWNQADV